MGDGDRERDESSVDSTTVQFRGTYDWSATEPSVAAVNALAAVGNVDPTELATGLETILYDHVDPEALDRLVGGGKPGCITVIFTVDHYRIRFEDDELVVCSCDR